MPLEKNSRESEAKDEEDLVRIRQKVNRGQWVALEADSVEARETSPSRTSRVPLQSDIMERARFLTGSPRTSLRTLLRRKLVEGRPGMA